MTRVDGAPLTPDDRGDLRAAGPVTLVAMGERLQARIDRFGVDRVSLWGAGDAAAVRFEPAMPAEARVRVEPNRITYAWPGGSLRVSVATHAPAIVVDAEGAAPTLRLRPARRPAIGFETAPRLRAHHADASGDGPGWAVDADWSITRLGAPDAIVGARGRVAFGPSRRLVLAAGADAGELRRAYRAALDGSALRDLDARHERLARSLRCDDPVLQSLATHALHTAFSARRSLPDGRFAGFAAGFGYAVPARTYYRDAYWTLQALLPLAPGLAREQLLLLAREVDDEGRAPSGVIVATSAGERSWRARRAADPALARDHPKDGVWWADHADSPLFFVLLAGEVAAWCGDEGLLDERVGGATLAAKVAAALDGPSAACGPSGLPVKPPHDRDWADNVFRGGAVTYQVGLLHGALLAGARLFDARSPHRAAGYRARAQRLRAAADAQLWDDARGHYVEFREPSGRAETHLAIDTLTALRYGLAADDRALRTLASVRDRLETRHNHEQPYGDWGVMCAYPPYAPWVRRRAKSRFPYRYHNGGDWPYWDGVYAEARLRRGLPGWRYPLTRAWTYGLERGWTTPVEYHAPPYAPGSPSNAWSAMPVAAMLLGGYRLTPTGGVARPPWSGTLERTLVDGRRQRVRVDGETLEVDHDG